MSREREPMDHAELRDLCAAHALGSLDPADAIILEEHLRDGCEDCERELALHRRTVDTLGASVEPMAPPPGARERLMARVDADRRSERPARVPAVRHAGRWALPLAASLIAAAGIWIAWDRHQEATRLAAQNRGFQQVMNTDPGGHVRVFELECTGEAAATHAYLYMDVHDPENPADDEWKIYADDPVQPAAGSYQAWLVTGDAVHHLGAVEPGPDGEGIGMDELPAVEGDGMFQVTLETGPVGARPTGPVMFQYRKIDLHQPGTSGPVFFEQRQIELKQSTPAED